MCCESIGFTFCHTHSVDLCTTCFELGFLILLYVFPLQVLSTRRSGRMSGCGGSCARTRCAWSSGVSPTTRGGAGRTRPSTGATSSRRSSFTKSTFCIFPPKVYSYRTQSRFLREHARQTPPFSVFHIFAYSPLKRVCTIDSLLTERQQVVSKKAFRPT